MRIAALSVFLFAGLQLGALAGEALDVRVTTDRSIDPTSVRTIVKSVCKPDMTEEQKAVAPIEAVPEIAAPDNFAQTNTSGEIREEDSSQIPF